MNKWRETIIPILWLWAAFIIIGVEVGVWIRGGK